MSTGQQVGTVVGGIIGAYFGYPQLGAAIGGYIGGVVDPTIIKGPSIGDAQQQTSLAGAPIPKCYGRCPPIAPTLIDGDKVARKVRRQQAVGKGATQKTEFETFIATRAFLVCEGEIAGYARITRNGKLVYSTVPGDQIDADSSSFASQITIYLGTETQGPDPSLEAIHGVGNTPYYRGRSYFVVRDDDETQTGGAANQYRIEVVAVGTSSSACKDYAAESLIYFPLDDAVGGGTAMEVIQGYNGTYSAGVMAGPPLRAGSAGSMRVTANDYMLAEYLDVFRINGAQSWTVRCWFRCDDIVGGSVIKAIANCWAAAIFGEFNWGLFLSGTDNMQPSVGYTVGTPLYSAVDPVPTAEGAAGYLVLTYTPVDGDSGTLRCYHNAQLVDTLEDVPAPTSTGLYLTAGSGRDYPASYGFNGCISDLAMDGHAFTQQEVNDTYWSIVDYYTLPDVAGALVNRQGDIVRICNQVIEPEAVEWRDVVADIAGRANGLLPARLDIDHMTDAVPGFVLGNPSLTAKDYIRTLCLFYFTDMPEYDGMLHAVRRGGPVVATLDEEDMLTVEDEDDDVRSQAVEAYQRITVVYPDPANNYVTTPQTAFRSSPDVTSSNVVNIQCPIPFDANTMAQKADILQRIAFLQVEGRFKRAFTAQYSKYVPSDPVMFQGRRYIIDKASNDESMVRFECTYDRPSAYTSNATGSSGSPPAPQSSNMKGPTLFAAMNLPQLRTADNSPGMYIAGCGILPGWGGYDLYLSVDGGVTEQKVGTFIDAAVMGALDADLASDGTSFTVKLFNGEDSLESISDEQLAARQNGWAITTAGESELGQFKTAADLGDLVYEASDLSREQLGTTAAEHNEGDIFVLLDTGLFFLPLDISLAGKTLIFRPVSRGTVPANNETYSVVFDPKFTNSPGFDFYTNGAGEKYSNADGAFYYKAT